MATNSQPRIASFAYSGVETPEFERWSTIGPAVFGLELAAPEADGAVRLRCDERHHRLAVHPGERSRLAYLGWDVADTQTLEALIAKLAAHGIAVRRDETELRVLRRVRELASFVDPFGFRHELVLGALETRPFEPGRPMHGPFVTGDGGMGHAVLLVPDLPAATEFYTNVLGFAPSDTIDAFTEIRFFHANPRHHSLALVAAPNVRGLHHLMFEVSELDDVGVAYDRLGDHDVPITLTLGRHPNDRMFSFYARVPGGFEVEYGWGALRIEDSAAWPVGRYDRISEWGHKMQDVGMPGMIEVMQTA